MRSRSDAFSFIEELADMGHAVTLYKSHEGYRITLNSSVNGEARSTAIGNGSTPLLALRNLRTNYSSKMKPLSDVLRERPPRKRQAGSTGQTNKLSEKGPVE